MLNLAKGYYGGIEKGPARTVARILKAHNSLQCNYYASWGAFFRSISSSSANSNKGLKQTTLCVFPENLPLCCPSHVFILNFWMFIKGLHSLPSVVMQTAVWCFFETATGSLSSSLQLLLLFQGLPLLVNMVWLVTSWTLYVC